MVINPSHFKHAVRIAVVLILLFSTTFSAEAKPRKHKPVGASGVDSSYVFALAAANHFLYAWQTGDLESGTVLLDDHVRRSQTAEAMETLFAASSQRTYEITRGKGNRGRYRFPVALITMRGSQIHRKFTEIIVVTTGKNDWAIDKLP